MTGKTHVAVGAAAALAITHPASVSGVIAAAVGGSLGGWIVDIDIRDRFTEDMNNPLAIREAIYDAIIDFLFMGIVLLADFLSENGLCQYVVDNWGIRIWISLLCIIILCILALISSHRTFTHSFFAMALFSGAMFFFCKPCAIPFAIGYATHLILDLFNMRGEQLFFPFKWRISLKLCRSNGKTDKILFWTALVTSVVIGAFFLSTALNRDISTLNFISLIQRPILFGLNFLQLYLIVINVFTFLGFQRSWKLAPREEAAEDDDEVRIQLEFETWLLDILALIGGGIGMLLALLIHLSYPSAYNGNWWAICYSSVMFWFTIYCYICKPFESVQLGFLHNLFESVQFEFSYKVFEFVPFDISQPQLFCICAILYLVVVNGLNAGYLFSTRNKHFDEYSPKHTLVILLGFIGGTLGAILMVLATHHEGKYNYVVFGFSLMLVCQIVFGGYMVSTMVL